MYAELHCHSYFSLLDGASSPEDLVSQAVALGLHSLALTDHDSLAGAIRFWKAAQQARLHAVIGAELTMEDGCHLTLLAENQAGYANLCRLITASRVAQVGEWSSHAAQSTWSGKVAPALEWQQLEAHAQGLVALTGCRQGPAAAQILRGREDKALHVLKRLRSVFDSGNLYIELQHHYLPDDDKLIKQLLKLAGHTELPVVATNNVHYTTRRFSMLRDALLAIRHKVTLLEARRAGLLPLNSNYQLTAPAEMMRKFAERPDAVANGVAIAERCQVSLDFSAYRLPQFEVNETHLRPQQERALQAAKSSRGRQTGSPDDKRSWVGGSWHKHPPLIPSPFQKLYALCHDGLRTRYPDLQPRVLKQLAHELEVIEQAGLADYFLIVWNIVAFAKQQGIRCQGRGSAAGSIVAYLLGISSVDPLAHGLLFERFLSSDRFTMPDIDVDLAADRREEVIQYVYNKYGRSHVSMVCNVVTYQARLALRDLGKVLSISEDTIVQMEARLDTNSPQAAAESIEAWLSAQDGASALAMQHAVPGIRQLAFLLRCIDGCPRHLSIHSGGMVITRTPLEQIVPLEPATMPGRYVCQWSKDCIEDAGLIKIDLLALRTLGMISEVLHHVQRMSGATPDLDALPLDDPAIYHMLQRADTIGAFQVESRAQQQMAPRLKPVCFEDIAVQVAIVRPGPIQGGAVHPYLRRRAGEEQVSYLHPTLEPVLRESLGVVLFQEQAIRISMVAAGFTPGEADLLRRALSRNRPEVEMAALRARFLRGAHEKEIAEDTARAIFDLLAAFAGYGFCKSHATAFALIAYQTLWLKRYYPPAFYCSLLNHQPMGFYLPEVILGDAKRHGVVTLPPDINKSSWLYTIEQLKNRRWALRTGLHAIAHVGQQAWRRIEETRKEAEFVDLEDFCRRTRLPQDVVTSLIRAGACDCWAERRQLLWRLGELDYRADELDLVSEPVEVDLPALDALEQTIWEHELMGMSAHCQVIAHYRQGLRSRGILSNWQVKQADAGRRVRVAGYVVVRQQPATAKGVLFISLEDESGLLDLVVKPDVYQRLRDTLRGHPLIVAHGVVQRNGWAVSVLLQHAEPLI